MTPLRLTSWFRPRMGTLVAITSLVVASAAPMAFYLRERWDLVQGARERAERASVILRAEVDERPRLWRYDAPKLSQRLAAIGFDLVHLRLHDANGIPVAVETAAAPRRPLWGHVPLLVDGRREADIWVAVDQGPLLVGTAQLGGAFVLLALLLGLVLYLLPVRAIARAERRIGALWGRLTLALQEEDRARIARELHDGAGQAITAARLELSALRARGVDPHTLDRVVRVLDEALDEVRRSTTALAPPALAELGLRRALERHCEAFAEAAGLSVICEVAEELPPLAVEVETACYRIVQEALTNTARHAGARRAWVHLNAADLPSGPTIRIEVGDDGQGFDPAQPGTGSGLEGVRKRARLLGGELRLSTHPGAGVRLEVTLPVQPAGEGASAGSAPRPAPDRS